MTGPGSPRPSVLYVVTEPWYFANHRLDHARALLADGFDVHVATRRGERWGEIDRAGCELHEIDLGRGSGSVGAWLGEMRALRRIVRSVRPGIVHAVALKPVAISLALLPKRHRPALILSVNGLGLSAATGGRRLRMIRFVIRTVSRIPGVTLLFQTTADRRALLGDRVSGTVIPGVGVDIERFRPGERPSRPPTVVVYLGRAVVSKGLTDLAAACELGGLGDVEVHLYCSIDDSSPGALQAEELARLARSPVITVHPPTSEPMSVLGAAHASILPSRAGEGVSKFVLESLACGTPVLLSEASGSGEVITAGETGVVFTAADPRAINAALREIADWSESMWCDASAACREAAERDFSLDVILPRIVRLHRDALAVRGRR